MLCKVCNTPSKFVFKGPILKKHDVAYYRCDNCDFLQTEEPYWLDEAYSSAISDLDLGPVNRAISGARITESTIVSCFDPNASFIDWGGGYGVFTRLMRDRGYDFYWRDPFCQNLFAKQFVADLGRQYELATCFEVFEHLVQPVREIDAILKLASNILFSTMLPQKPIEHQSDWWYLTPEHGQHISIYSLKTLRYLADKFKVHLASDGSTMHLFSRRQVSQRLFRAIVRDGRISQAVRRIGRRKLRTGSLLMPDFRAVTGWDA